MPRRLFLTLTAAVLLCRGNFPLRAAAPAPATPPAVGESHDVNADQDRAEEERRRHEEEQRRIDEERRQQDQRRLEEERRQEEQRRLDQLRRQEEERQRSCAANPTLPECRSGPVLVISSDDLFTHLAHPAPHPGPSVPVDPHAVTGLAGRLLSEARGEGLSPQQRRVAGTLAARYERELREEGLYDELTEAARLGVVSPAVHNPFPVYQALFLTGAGDMRDAPAAAGARLGYRTAMLPPPAGGARPPLPEALRGLTFTRADGTQVGIDELTRDGKAVVIQFGAQWCPGCNSAQMHQRLADLQARFGSGLTVVGITAPGRDGRFPNLREYAGRKGIPLATLTTEQIEALGVQSYPNFGVIGSNGAWTLQNQDTREVLSQDQLIEMAAGAVGSRDPPLASVAGAAPAPQDTVVKIEVSGAAGSATLVYREGNTYYALTAAHVTEVGRSVLRLTRANGQVIPATNLRVIARGPGDVSLVQFESTDTTLPVSPIAGRGYQPTISQPVLMAGYPRAGPYVQDSAHLFRYFSDLLSTDKNTISGMSGGGLFDVNGQLIGVCNVGGPCGGYAPLRNIQAMLDRAGLSRIYSGGATTSPPAGAPQQAWWRTVGMQLALARAAGGGPGGRPGDPLGDLFDGSGPGGRGVVPGPNGGEPGVPVAGPGGPGAGGEKGKPGPGGGDKPGEKGGDGGEKKPAPSQAGAGCGASSANAADFGPDAPYGSNFPGGILALLTVLRLKRARWARRRSRG